MLARLRMDINPSKTKLISFSTDGKAAAHKRLETQVVIRKTIVKSLSATSSAKLLGLEIDGNGYCRISRNELSKEIKHRVTHGIIYPSRNLRLIGEMASTHCYAVTTHLDGIPSWTRNSIL